ncbi:MAG: hypothetical protein IPL79_03495 [Myxococcales bacterium]|nr:hypothetical protein [Myxococcales bacterium]
MVNPGAPLLLAANGAPLVVYHGSDVADSRVSLRENADGLVHVSTRAGFAKQYGATLQAFHISAPNIFVWSEHGHMVRQVVGPHSVVDQELGVNSHRDAVLHADLRRLGFMGYRYQQYDFERDRAVTNYALFDAQHLEKSPSP